MIPEIPEENVGHVPRCYNAQAMSGDRTQLERARLLLELGRPADALAATQRALAENASDPECLELAGLCLLRLGRASEALGPLGQAIGGRPEGAHALYLYGFALRETGQHSAAEAPFRDALRCTPDEPVYLRALAELCADLGRTEEGLDLARRAAAVGPDRAANHVSLGYVASAAGRKDEARAAYGRAVTLDPADAAAWNNLGCLDLEAGNALLARARFRQALKLDPQGERAQRNLRLATPPDATPQGTDDRSVERLIAQVAAELGRARADRLLLLALFLEAPAALDAFVRGGRRGLWLTGGVTALALGELGALALWPLGLVGAAAGLALLGSRGLRARRAEVRRVLDEGRARHQAVWRRWLDGALERASRDAELDALAEELALALAVFEGERRA